MKDWSEKARVFCDRWKPIREGEGTYQHMLADYGRYCAEEARREAYEDAAKIVKEKEREAINYYRDVGRNNMIVFASENALTEIAAKAKSAGDGK